MSKPEDTKPEDCPEPYNHEVFRYCPSCTWVEESDAPSITIDPMPGRANRVAR